MVQFTLILIFPAMVFEALAIGIVEWSVSDESSQGLWRYRYTSRNMSSCCQNIDDKFDDTPGIYFICLSLYLHSAHHLTDFIQIGKKVQPTTFSKQ